MSARIRPALLGASGGEPVQRERRGASRAVRAFAAQLLRLRLGDVHVVALDRLRRGRQDRLGKPLGLDETGPRAMAADRARVPVLDPPRPGEVAADDELDGQHLEASTFERAPIGSDREEVVSDDLARAGEPERREAGEDPALVGDLRREHDVEGRDAVGCDEEQLPLTERVDLADLPARDVRRLRHGRHRAWPRASAADRRWCRRGRCTRRGRRPRRGRREPRPRRLPRTSSAKSSSSSHARMACRCTSRYAMSRERPLSTSASSSRWLKNRPWLESTFARMRSGRTTRPSTSHAKRSSA